MDTDIHLDTSWCPVCDCLIMPKRYTVPIQPPPTPLPQQPALVTSNSTTSIKGATRGKHGTIKGRAHGGGLLQGTGRVRPGGGLRPNVPNKAKSPQRAAQEPVVQELPVTPVRTRTVIDQSQTPLYCSEACRKKDLEWAWPVPMPSAREILERDSSADRLKATDSAHLATKTKSHGKEKRVSLGAHPAQLNPAHASPPPPSPVLPPVPPNSWRAPNLRDLRALDLGETTLRLARSDSDTSSSATGTSFTASASAEERSPGEERSDGLSNLYTDPAPPPIPPLPLHPHRASAPASAPPTANTSSADKRPLFEGGILMAARRLQAIFARARRTASRRRRRGGCGRSREARANRRAGKVEAKPEEVETIDPARWSDLVYNYGGNSNPRAPAGVISTHRRPSTGAASDPQANAGNTETVRRPLVRAPGAPTRTQSALELYAKYPLFVRAPSSSSTSHAPRAKSNASLATSYAPAFGLVTSTSASKSASTKSAATSVSNDAHSGTSALTLPGVDPALYAGKKRAAPRRVLAKGVEGKLLVPDVLLRSTVSASLPASSLAGPVSPAPMRRSGSEASVSGRSRRSAGALGSVREEGVEGEAEGTWHRPAEEMSEDGTGTSVTSASVTSGSRKGHRSRGERKEKKGKSRAEMSAPERRRMNMEARNWTYDNVEGPIYDAMPAVPIKQTRYEEIFFPDPLPATSTSLPTSLPTASTSAAQESTQEVSADEKPYIETSALHARDIELSRRAIREVGSRRGEHRGRAGVWVEKEWEVTVIPERKKLFLFGSGTGRTQ
ncbi:hypothetical protein DFH11DRAFT_1773660 [Phellopilus nigrolimitatus]|nr:hypothetical protein DFH11DRAFT_1773660 [Phellopilus nigrolimitatus]